MTVSSDELKSKKAKFLALVPCCQAEVARLLEEVPPAASRELQSLWRHGVHKREFGSHLTNEIRCLYLESKGYKVRVTELIGWEHSLKNEIILAVRVQGSNSLARKQLDALLERVPLAMKLFELLPGGIQALVSPKESRAGGFVNQWMSIAAGARKKFSIRTRSNKRQGLSHLSTLL